MCISTIANNGWEYTDFGKLHRGQILVLQNEIQRDSLTAPDHAFTMRL